MVSEQKSIGQYMESFVKPSNEGWSQVEITRRTVPRLPKITTKQLISVVNGRTVSAGNIAAQSRLNSERQYPSDLQLVRSYSINKSTRNSTDGFCYYYNKKPMKRNV